MNRPLIMEGANLYCGIDPTASNHLVLQEIRLPSLERNYVDHAPGGAPVAVEVDTHITRLEVTFTLAGWQPQVLGLIGSGDQTFTIYGLVRDRKSGRALDAMAIIQGRLGRATPTPFNRGTIQSHEYSIRGIMYYTLTLDYLPVFSWDFYNASGGVFTSQALEPFGMITRGFGGVFNF